MSKLIRILAIESSADETSAAVLEGQKRSKKFHLLSNAIYSQIKIHQKTGGIVPEVAARSHIVKILPVIKQALANAGMQLKNINAIAVTAGPGLITSLMIGVDTARALAFALNIPLIPVNHHEGHLLSAMGAENFKFQISNFKFFPALGLVVSGGHTMLVLVKKIGQYKILGQTLDDAAGECFDKVAKILALPYPGGPEISRLAQKGNPHAIDFPRPMLKNKNYNFSFSGLKTSVLYFVQNHPSLNASPSRGGKIKNKFPSLQGRGEGRVKIADIAASVEQAIIDVLVSKTIQAAAEFRVKTILLGGGVSANQKLRRTLKKEIQKNLPATSYQLPPASLTTDNAGMIAIVGFYKYCAKKTSTYHKTVANPNWALKSWAY